MSIRKYSYPRALDLSTGLQEVLRKNGIQAHITDTPNGYQMIVLGHDSPVLTYNLNEKQVENLMGWGSTYQNKRAYNTFASIVGKDFYLPDNFVSASNAFGRVAMGLHGYRVGVGEYGIRKRGVPYYAPLSTIGRGWGGDFIGWTPRQQGFHLRRIGDHAYRPTGSVIVPERPDGRIKPGEARSGGYGFYYKGSQQQTSIDVLDNLTIQTQENRKLLEPLEAAPRTQGQGIPFSELIDTSSEVTNAFTYDKFHEVLKSHGIVIDETNKTITVQSNLSKVDLQYDLTDDELKKLTANKLTGKDSVSIDERLAVINNVIKKDFDTALTKEMLETKELVSLDLKPEVRSEVEAPFIERERLIAEQERIMEERAKYNAENEAIRQDPNAINGRDIQAIMGNRGWFQPVEHGREMYVSEIRVDKIPVITEDKTNEQLWEESKANITDFDSLSDEQKEAIRIVSDRTNDFMRENQGKCMMTAVINGQVVSHAISEKDYQKFLDLDDKHRLMMFDKIFKEVEIKAANGRGMYGDDMYMSQDGQTVIRQEDMGIEHATNNKVNGAALQELNEKKAFYRERANGREVEVGNIQVDPAENGKYKMTAVINGETISHEITQKEYDKFLAVDDYQRMKLFSKVFNEVDMKTKPGQGVNIGAAILAAFVATGELVRDLTMGPIGYEPAPRPEIYESRTGPATTYFKPGVVSPADVAAANFRAQEASIDPTPGQGVGRGL